MEPVTESQSLRTNKHSLKDCPDNKIRVLLDSGSDRYLFFLPKEKDELFPYLMRQVPKSWHMSNGCFLTKGRGKVALKFIEYSNSKEYTVNPDVMEYD